jgi:hypothetical protein
MTWVSGTLRDADGNAHSLPCAASDVYLADGRTAEAAVSSLETQSSSLAARITSLQNAVASLAAAATAEE